MEQPHALLAEDHFPLPEGWQQNPGPALAERLRRVDEALAPAAISLSDLPGELVPFVAWVLCEWVCDKRRRARAGHLVPGAHVFLYFAGPLAWRHAEAVENRNAGKGVAVLRYQFALRASHPRPRPGEGHVVAGLLVRVSDEGRVTVRKLVWVGSSGEAKETATLPRADATLSPKDFRRALADLEGFVVQSGGDLSRLADTFVVDNAEKLRALFTAGAGGG